jgi:hypothetical protein
MIYSILYYIYIANVYIIKIDMQNTHTILDIKARQIYDSRGQPTVEC